MRVAAYCRVSSDSSDQLHSFAAQVQHYTKFIGENERMELADIYADEGITGTKTAKRDDFNRLVADCKKGKIDRVLTKSVSRFARNTADSLMYARLLKEYGVSILFEKENIDTAYMSSELLLALSGAQAQEESISISKNMRWSVERRMKSGTYLSSSTPYGYELKDGEFRIVESEAEIVRLIFKSFLSGMGKKAIADMLNEMNAPKRFGYATWRINTVGYILTNVRYIGDALLQKKYTTDTLPFVKRINRGEKAQYYVENMNPPIIFKADYEAAQRLIQKNCIEERADIVPRPLTQKIRCKCGAAYAPLCVNGNSYFMVHGAPPQLYGQLPSDAENEIEFAVWTRLMPKDMMPFDKTVIFGHTPTAYYQEDVPLRIWHGGDKIGIDCGAGKTHPSCQLACLRLDDMTEFYSEY